MRILNKKIIIFSLIMLCNCFVFADSTYKVEKGDTLYSISKKYQITVAELRAANNLSETDVIKIGQKLIIPTADISTAAALATDNSAKKSTESEKSKQQTPSTESVDKNTLYTVEKGDTLYGIARKNNITVAELMNMNKLDSSAVIKIGQKLIIKENKKQSVGETVVIKEDKKENTNKDNSNNSTSTDTPDTRTYGTTVNADSTTVWPVSNPKVTTVKGKASGVQLSASPNEVVKCIHEGTVMYVGVYRGYGQLVFVQSKTGIIYSYAGLGSVKVKKGDYVRFGSELATAGVDSRTGKSMITFMVFQNGQPIDPAKAPRN